MVRLVKGAYWDTEIKLSAGAGAGGLSGLHPQAERPMSPTWLAPSGCWPTTDAFYPQFATHNAHTLAAVVEMAGNRKDFEFQRLHGMGEALYEQVVGRTSWARCLPGLRAGRQPRGPAGLSGAAAAGERRQHLLRQPHRRREAADRARSSPTRSTKVRANDRCRTRASRCPCRPVRRRAAQLERARPHRSATGCVPLASEMAEARWPAGPRPPIDRPASARAGEARRRHSIRPTAAGSSRRGRRGRPMPSRSIAALPGQRAFAAPAWDATPAEERAALPGAHADLMERDTVFTSSWRCAVREAGKTIPTPSPRCARRSTSAATTRPGRAEFAAPLRPAGPDRRAQRDRAARPRRFRLHQSVELPAGDLHGPGDGGAGRRQRGDRQAGRADAADRPPLPSRPAARAGVPADVLQLLPGRRPHGRRAADRRSAHRRRRLHRLDRDGAAINRRSPRARGRSCR